MIVDLILIVDGLRLENESIDEFVDRISAEVDSAYPILYEVTGVDDGQ